MMQIRFVNTSGGVLQLASENIPRANRAPLGTMLSSDNFIYIYDREADDEITQLPTNIILFVLKYVFNVHTGPITIYLPQMTSALLQEADLQARFVKISDRQNCGIVFV